MTTVSQNVLFLTFNLNIWFHFFTCLIYGDLYFFGIIRMFTVDKRKFLESDARLTFKICADIPQTILFFKSWNILSCRSFFVSFNIVC